MFGLIKSIVLKIQIKLMLRSQFDSVRLREYFERNFGIRVGMYSYGCFDPTRIRSGVTIGRYCSIAPSVNIFTRNHPLAALSTHPMMYEPWLGLGPVIDLPFGSLEIGDDVWIGHNAVVLPSVRRIGRGSVIGAGSIVTHDVPQYGVVAGNPARLTRMRFDEKTIARIEKSRWWELSMVELSELMREAPVFFTNPAIEK